MAEVDWIAQRYRRLPSEILSLSLGDYSINALVAQAGAAQEAKK